MISPTAKKYLSCFLTALLTLTLGLALLGRRIWCVCGEVTLFAWDPVSQHNSQHLIDFYSPSHFIHGLCFYLLFTHSRFQPFQRFALTLLMESCWELLENTSLIIERYRAVTSSFGYSGDSIANSLSDLSFCSLGFLVAGRVRWQISLAIFLTLELTTGILIRDGFILNVIMLLFPLDSIRVWQSSLNGVALH